MSKWNKPNKEISQEFLENEERRKQMIIEAARRRKEKQRKLQEDEENNRRLAQQKLVKHKLEKKQAYVKYLRNNMHDKYEEIKRNSREKGPEIKSISKWQRKSKEKDSNLEALDLQIEVQKKQESQKKQPKISQKRKMLSAQFQKQWNQTQKMDEMIGSKLLDSLDLDFGTIHRQQQLKQISRQSKYKSKQQVAIDQIKNLIGYESVLVSIDQKLEIKNNCKKLNQKQNTKAPNKALKGPEVNEGEVFNQLKNKKEGKIWSWAIEQEHQAEDLFSNCSSKKASIVLKKLNEELKSNKSKPIVNKQGKNGLAPILQVQNKNAKPANSSKEKYPSKQKQAAIGKHSRQKSQSRQRKTMQIPSTSQKNITRIRKVSASGKSQSKEKKSDPKQTRNDQGKQARKVPRTSDHRRELPPLYKAEPPLPDPTLMTHEHQFQIESFIKDDLINLNEEEKKLQQDLRNIHLKNKKAIKQVEQKYQIKTNYKNSNELMQNNYIQEKINYYEKPKEISLQDNLEESIQRLNDILLAKEMKKEDDDNQSRQTMINPLSKPGDLHQQILQLAENISKYDKKNQTNDGYGYGTKNKMKKVKGKEAEETSCVEAQKLSESQEIPEEKRQIILPLQKPPEISYYPSEQSRKSPQFFYQQIDEDLKSEKINVNQRLKKLLLDD